MADFRKIQSFFTGAGRQNIRRFKHQHESPVNYSNTPFLCANCGYVILRYPCYNCGRGENAD